MRLLEEVLLMVIFRVIPRTCFDDLCDDLLAYGGEMGCLDLEGLLVLWYEECGASEVRSTRTAEE